MKVINQYKYNRVVEHCISKGWYPEAYVYVCVVKYLLDSDKVYRVVVGYKDTRTGYIYFQMEGGFYRTTREVVPINRFKHLRKSPEYATYIRGTWA